MKAIIQVNSVPSREDVLAGVRRAMDKVVEQAKCNNAELVIADKNGKPILVKACNL